MKKLKSIIVMLGLLVGAAGALFPVSVGAVNVFDACNNAGNSDTAVCQSQGDEAQSIIGQIVNVLLFILGAVCVIVVIIGGIMFATSSGSADQVKRAKDTVMYAVIGLAIAIISYAAVNWVFRAFS